MPQVFEAEIYVGSWNWLYMFSSNPSFHIGKRVSPDNQFWKIRLKQNPISYFSPSIALQTLQTCLWPYIQTWKRLYQKAPKIYPLMYFFKIMQLLFYDFVQCALWKQISYIVTVEYTRWAPEMEIVWVFFRRIFCFESFWEFFYPINLNFISILYKFLYFTILRTYAFYIL